LKKEHGKSKHINMDKANQTDNDCHFKDCLTFDRAFSPKNKQTNNNIIYV